jgi:chromosome segregation protein
VRLKQLEIKGFKSFADKTVINLDNQITGIVGPNGCGKSNIVDAIRWVIGEHKIKSLRSEHLEDLVFNGSKSRNASGLAEVALTFENTKNLLPTEFNTVTVSRKFYKNGDSEYRLNDVTCRLKDITNLFLDTGVSNDSYAIIELGMVDDIIKDKDNGRRKMLEQAAGISIYKTRKKEAKLKLDATEQDLNRIEDLLFEISNNLRTLESQARKAEKYLQIKEEYKTISIELVKASLNEFNGTYQTLNSQQQEEVDKIIAIETSIAKEDAVMQANKLELSKREEALHLLQKAFNELQASILKQESDKNLNAQRIQHLLQLKGNTEAFLKDADRQIAEITKSVETSSKKVQTETEGLQALQQKMQITRATLDTKRATFDTQKAKLDELRKLFQALQMQHFEAEKQVAVADNTISNIHNTQTQLHNENGRRTTDIEELKKEVAKVSADSEAKQKDLAQMIEKRDAATAKILETQAQLETKRNLLVEENRALDSTQNEYNLLKSLVDSLEGYPDSVKYLANNTSWKSKSILLSDVMNVQDSYRIGIENYLENYLNYYVVDTAQDAYGAIQLLDGNKKGKAGFFILKEYAANKNPEVSIDNAQLASKCVKVKAGYEKLMDSLLHNVYVVETEQDALNVLVENATIIAKNGKVIRKGNTIMGGAIGLFEGNKIGRTERLAKLGAEIEALKESTQKLKQIIADTHALIVGFNQELNEGNIKSLEQTINNLNNQQIQWNGKIENYQAIVTQTTERLEQLKEQEAKAIASIADTKEKFVGLNKNIEEKRVEITSNEQSFKAAEGEYNKASEEYNQQNVLLTRQQGVLSELNTEIEIRKNQLKDIEQKVITNTAQLENTTKEQAETDAKFKETEAALHANMQKKATDLAVLNETDAAFYVFRNEIAEAESKLTARRKEKESAETILNEIKEKLTGMQLQLAGMKERLKVEFRVDIDEVLKGERVTEDSIEDMQATVEKLRKRIENLGEVNPMAVEAFKEMKGRHDFIQEQKTDLVTAKESLLQTIEEVENTANKKFVDTFNQVRENFVKVFQALFTEQDHCDLKMVDPENPSDTAIEIYAQPKGKRPSTITQLSGGEKTLTSTAFLFAIYLIKPAPFCVLDEVDAPLDDANVAKFTQMIRRFSDNSQFIIVTHNKQTMSTVDVIYGVTMQEAGVSKLVPVDFRSLN